MLQRLTLQVLDQIRVNGFEVEVEEAGSADGRRCPISGCLVSEFGGASKVHAVNDVQALRALAEAYCTPAQVARLLRGMAQVGLADAALESQHPAPLRRAS